MSTCCNDNDASATTVNESGAYGNDNVANRAIDLSNMQLDRGLRNNKDFETLADGVIGANAEFQDLNLNLAEDMQRQRRDVYDPLEAQIVDEARNYDSPERMAQEMGRADAAVVQAYDKADRSSGRNQLRLGVNPNSGKAMAARENMSFDRAMASASAGNNAAEGLRKTGFGMRMGAAGLGANKAATQIGAANSASALGTASIGAFDKAADSQREVFRGANDALNTASNSFSNASTAYSAAARIKAAGAAAGDKDDADIGKIIGGFASSYLNR